MARIRQSRPDYGPGFQVKKSLISLCSEVVVEACGKAYALDPDDTHHRLEVISRV